MVQLPELRWPTTWVIFADWWDLAFGAVALLLIVLLVIWWRQQTARWFRLVTATFLAALILCIGSSYLFVVPPHHVGCEGLCAGRAGYPLPVARLENNGVRTVAPLDFLFNLLLLWLFWLGATLFWSLLSVAFQWWRRPWRTRLLFVLLVALLPWALLPRVFNPPQPQPVDEELRLAINAQRAAEFTYDITGAWVQRLALEDLRTLTPLAVSAAPQSLEGQGATEVCLRGYTYFFLPWRRYRITLDAGGTTALGLVELPLSGSCWSADAVVE